jgi:uncharacterized membrane protein
MAPRIAGAIQAADTIIQGRSRVEADDVGGEECTASTLRTADPRGNGAPGRRPFASPGAPFASARLPASRAAPRLAAMTLTGTPAVESVQPAPALEAPAARPADAPATRLASIDLIRGAVMILMAIDHVRVYAGVPAGGPTPGVFFTRWITHFCAPAFLFLAGTSAMLHGRRHPDLARFLVTRGAWLIVLELTVLRVAWTFNLDFGGYNMAGVIWAIGWSMILLAPLTMLGPAVAGAVGVLIVASHNLLDLALPTAASGIAEGTMSGLWKVLYLGFSFGPITLGESGPPLVILYTLIPWVGVMAAGYGFGALLLQPAARRDRWCLAIGLGATLLFLVLRGLDAYGDPRPWGAAAVQPGVSPVLAFLNTTKYPASLLFLLMTLGPTIALIPLLERARGAAARVVEVFGKVPFFFYVLHIPLIHALALVVSRVRLGVVSPWLFANHPMGNPPPPDGYRWSLPLLYAVWALMIVLLYPVCRWYASLKARRRDWWMRYI